MAAAGKRLALKENLMRACFGAETQTICCYTIHSPKQMVFKQKYQGYLHEVF